MKKQFLLFAAALILSGCAKTSPERHSYYFASHRSALLNGNMVSDANKNAKLNLPVFSKLYLEGKSDRSAGLPETSANLKAEQIRKANLSVQTSLSFINAPQAKKDIEQADPRDENLWANELKAVYLDGYRGIQ